MPHGLGATWAPAPVPATDEHPRAAGTYRCFLRVPDNMTSRAPVDLWSDSAMLSVADFSGGFTITLNGQVLAKGESLAPEPRRRIKIPKGILERGQFNVLAIQLGAANRGLRVSPVVSGYFDELLLAGEWEWTEDAVVAGDLQPQPVRPARAVYLENQFRESSTPLARSTDGVHGAHLTPADTLARLRPAAGWAVEGLLSEPEIAQPTHFSFDARGRLWVAQYRQYPYPAGVKMLSRDKYYRATFDRSPPPPPNHVPGADIISVHEDTDGDGRFDKHTMVLTNLNMANAVVTGHGGIWVMNTPYLLFYPDANGDDVPDGPPEVRLAGFGLEDTHSVANGLVWGPDGWLYGAQGSTTTSRVTRPGLDPPGAPGVYYESCMVWRYHPEQRRYEIFAEGGGNNFGLELDSAGRLYTGHNGGQTRGWHFIPGGIFLKQGKEPGKFGPPTNPYSLGELPMIASANSITRFSHHFAIADGNALPRDAAGDFFSVDPLHRQVIRSQATRRGSTLTTADTGVVLQSEDPSVRPVFIANAPDGSLYVADFYEEFIAHGQNYQGQIDPTTGRMYRLRGVDQPLERQVNLAGQTSAQLVALLAHANRWQRQTAVRLLGERRDPSVPPLLRAILARREPGPTKAATDAAALAGEHPALEALWALAQGGWMTDTDLEGAWRHPAPTVRMWALRLAADRSVLSPTFLAAVQVDLGSELDAEVRCHAAAAARRLPVDQSLALLLALARRDVDVEDPYIPLLGWHGLERWCGDAPEAVLRLTEVPEFWRSKLAREHWLGRMMRRWAMESTQSSLQRCATLLQRSTDAEMRRRLRDDFETALAGSPLPVLPAALLTELKAAGANSLPWRLRQREPEAIQEALAMVSDAQARPTERTRLVQVLGEIRATNAVPTLLVLARGNASDELRRSALGALAAFSEPDIGRELALAYATLPAGLRSATQGILASRPQWHNALVELLENKVIAAGDLSVEAWTRLRASTNPALAQRLAPFAPRSPVKLGPALREEAERIRGALAQGSGSPYAGEPIFLERCAGCHQLFHKGGRVGPNLTAYQRDDLNTLLPSLLDPSAEIREGYRNFLATLKDGRILTGIVVDQTTQRVVFRGADGVDVAVEQAEIQELTPATASLMPDGLLEGLSEQQLRDFFAYLRIPQPISR